MKLLADVRMLCRSVSVSILAISVIGQYDSAGIQFLGVMSYLFYFENFPFCVIFLCKCYYVVFWKF